MRSEWYKWYKLRTLRTLRSPPYYGALVKVFRAFLSSTGADLQVGDARTGWEGRGEKESWRGRLFKVPRLIFVCYLAYEKVAGQILLR